MNTNNFHGVWVLNREKSVYEMGTPPKTGSYKIIRQDHLLEFTMDWVDAEDKAFHQVYFTNPDGTDHPYENPAIADTVTTTLVDDFTMDTVSKKAGQILVSARRAISPDGQTMTITMQGKTPQGQDYTNLAIYEKQHA